jgi:hypothetical protein
MSTFFSLKLAILSLITNCIFIGNHWSFYVIRNSYIAEATYINRNHGLQWTNILVFISSILNVYWEEIPSRVKKKYVSIIKEKAPKSSNRHDNWDIVESGVKYHKKSTKMFLQEVRVFGLQLGTVCENVH